MSKYNKHAAGQANGVQATYGQVIADLTTAYLEADKEIPQLTDPVAQIAAITMSKFCRKMAARYMALKERHLELARELGHIPPENKDEQS